MCCRYLNNPREALKEFHLARKDPHWSSQALVHMAEVYLNPENDVAWTADEAEGDQRGGNSGSGMATAAETAETIKAASTLLQQLKPEDLESNKCKVML
jgi:tetratricopeptide repeat protein 21B